MKIVFLEESKTYFGGELSTAFANPYGDTVAIGFIGPCDVSTERLVDLEDKARGDWIKASLMVHVIVQLEKASIMEAVLFQRLIVARVAEICRAKTDLPLLRSGNDLFVGVERKKLSVSVATPSVDQSKCLIHLGVNWDCTGAPSHVSVTDLRAMGWSDPKLFCKSVFEAIRDEWETSRHSCVKVRPVI